MSVRVTPPEGREMAEMVTAPVITGPLGALPSGYPPSHGVAVSALSMPVVHVDRSHITVMRPPAPKAKPQRPAVPKTTRQSMQMALEKRIDALMAEDEEDFVLVGSPEGAPEANTSGALFNRKKPAPKLPPTVKFEEVEANRGGDKKAESELDDVFFDVNPNDYIAKTLGDDMAFDIKIVVIPGHYAPKNTKWAGTLRPKRVMKFRIDILGLTGGSNGKKLLDALGNAFNAQITRVDPTDPEEKPKYEWLEVKRRGNFYICAQSEMSFYRIVGAVHPDWYDLKKETPGVTDDDVASLRTLLMSRVLLGDVDASQGATVDEKKEVFDFPVAFSPSGVIYNKWIYAKGQEDGLYKITAVDPEKLSALKLDPAIAEEDTTPVVDGIPVPNDTPTPDNPPAYGDLSGLPI